MWDNHWENQAQNAWGQGYGGIPSAGFGMGSPIGSPRGIGMGFGMGPDEPIQPPIQTGWGEPQMGGAWGQEGGWQEQPPMLHGGFGPQSPRGMDWGNGGYCDWQHKPQSPPQPFYMGGMGGDYSDYGGRTQNHFAESYISPMDGFGGNPMDNWFYQDNIAPVVHVKKRHNKMNNSKWGYDSTLFKSWMQ